MFGGPQQTLFPNERSTYPEACMKSRLVLIAFLLVTPQLAVADDICAKNPAPTQQSLYPWLDARCYVKLYDAKIGWTRTRVRRTLTPIDSAELLTAVGTFLATLTAFVSVSVIMLHQDPDLFWTIMIMLGWTEGEQYSGKEISEMLSEAGFTNVQVRPTFGYWSIVTAFKP